MLMIFSLIKYENKLFYYNHDLMFHSYIALLLQFVMSIHMELWIKVRYERLSFFFFFINSK